VSTKPAAMHHRRSTRDVDGRGIGSRPIRSGSVSTRNYDEQVRGLGAIQQRLLIDRLLQLQHGRRQQKRQQDIAPLATVFRKLSLSHGEPICIWPVINRDATNPTDYDQLKSGIMSDKISAVVKKASKQASGNTLEMLRSRPPIDPMLLMVGIGRK